MGTGHRLPGGKKTSLASLLLEEAFPLSHLMFALTFPAAFHSHLVERSYLLLFAKITLLSS